jgi:uncharacterized protein (TIGR03435 family)
VRSRFSATDRHYAAHRLIRDEKAADNPCMMILQGQATSGPMVLKWDGKSGVRVGKWISDPMTRAPRSSTLLLGLTLSLCCGIATGATAQGASSSHAAARQSAGGRSVAQEARGTNEVRISPSTMTPGSTSMEIGADRWSARGFDLKTLIAQVYDVDARRVDFPDEAVASVRYDVTLDLTDEDSQESIQHRLQTALEKRFGLAIATQSRAMDVYVLTAPNGPGPALRLHRASIQSASGNPLLKLTSLEDADPETEDPQQITYVGKDCSGIAAGGIAATAASLAEFRRTLEPDLDRLLVDDTHLGGSYDFKIGNYSNQQELFQLLRDQLGLVVAPARRMVTVLTVRASQG